MGHRPDPKKKNDALIRVGPSGLPGLFDLRGEAGQKCLPIRNLNDDPVEQLLFYSNKPQQLCKGFSKNYHTVTTS
jgi:hypothetical protein